MPDTPDRPDFLKDGTVRLFIDNGTVRLRRPKTGEFRKLRELLHATQDEIRTLADDARAQIETEREAEDEIETAKRLREIDRDLTTGIEDSNVGWTRSMADILGDSPLPEATDDWPTWLWSAEFITKLFEHWRAVPLGPGGG